MDARGFTAVEFAIVAMPFIPRRIDDEFIGVLFRDEEEGETAYQFQMAILDYDLGG